METTKNNAANTALWVSAVRPIIEEISDREIQDRRWFGRNPPEESSPDEVICTLMDTMHFDDAYKDSSLDLTDPQRAACAQFSALVDAFVRQHRDHLNEHEVIDDPEWEGIRQAAAELLKILPS